MQLTITQAYEPADPRFHMQVADPAVSQQGKTKLTLSIVAQIE
jgi:hypothetical protein